VQSAKVKNAQTAVKWFDAAVWILFGLTLALGDRDGRGSAASSADPGRARPEVWR